MKNVHHHFIFLEAIVSAKRKNISTGCNARIQWSKTLVYSECYEVIASKGAHFTIMSRTTKPKYLDNQLKRSRNLVKQTSRKWQNPCSVDRRIITTICLRVNLNELNAVFICALVMMGFSYRHYGSKKGPHIWICVPYVLFSEVMVIVGINAYQWNSKRKGRDWEKNKKPTAARARNSTANTK